jgi:hypothetical protein
MKLQSSHGKLPDAAEQTRTAEAVFGPHNAD